MHRKPPSASLCLKRSLFKTLWSFCPQFKAFSPLFLQVISLVCWHGELCKGTVWIFNTVTWGGELTPQESCHSLCASIESSGGAKKKGELPQHHIVLIQHHMSIIDQRVVTHKYLWLIDLHPRNILSLWPLRVTWRCLLFTFGSVQKCGKQWEVRCWDKVLKITFLARCLSCLRHRGWGALCAFGVWVADRKQADVSGFYFAVIVGAKQLLLCCFCCLSSVSQKAFGSRTVWGWDFFFFFSFWLFKFDHSFQFLISCNCLLTWNIVRGKSFG